ncbi:MAG: molybdenum cofactor guanylyltransferase [Planctomycetaceae bacterium]
MLALDNAGVTKLFTRIFIIFQQKSTGKPKLPDIGGVVLCGGSSSRMQRPKALLPFGESTSLQLVVDAVRAVASHVVVVAAPHQTLPELPQDVEILRDSREGLGPLAGIALGLSHLEQTTEAAYVTGCDVPLLRPNFIQHLAHQLGNHDIVMASEVQYLHPLAAVYRTGLGKRAWELIEANRMRPVFLREGVSTIDVTTGELRQVDPQLESLQNMNAPADYEKLLAIWQSRQCE